MTIECYFKSCRHHTIHENPDEGPFCDLEKCVATDKEITLFKELREQELNKMRTQDNPENKTYTVPEELQDIMVEASAYEDLRDIYVARPFGYKKAAKAAFTANKLRKEFWLKCVQTYPELLDKKLTYTYEGNLEIRK